MYYFCFSFFKGTGKTKTFVAAIQEIIHSNSDKCVLVCAQSNSACDEIAHRLLSVLNMDLPNLILRLYAKSVSIETISEKLKPTCNILNGRLEMPSIENIYRYRIVICTLSMAGQFTLGRKQYNTFHTFKPDHFTHIFIDEAACCQQSLALCAISDKY